MKPYIEKRAVEIGTYIVEKNATVRQAERLPQIDVALAKEARAVLDVNKSERHIRGGLATRKKYAHIH